MGVPPRTRRVLNQEVTVTTTPTWTNWSRSAKADPLRVETPHDLGALQEAVARAASEGHTIRAAGTGLSSNGLAAVRGVQIDVRGLRGLVSLDRTASTATFGAGTTVAEAAAILEDEGLALANPTSHTGVTLAGATATGSQGSSLRHPSMSSQLTGITLVTADGQALHLSERRNSELWPAARLHLGALGVLAEVTVRAVPRFRLRYRERREPLDVLLDEFETRARGADHLAVRWQPSTRHAVIREVFREDGVAVDAPEPGHAQAFIEGVRDGLLFGLEKSFPALVPTINRLESALHRDRAEVGGPVRPLVRRPTIPATTLQYAFPLGRLPEMTRATRALIESRHDHLPMRVRLSLAPAEDAFLSTSYGRETGSIGIAAPTGIDPRVLFHDLEELFLAGGGLPHWGSFHTVRAAEFAHVVPRFGEFQHARDRLDPERRFENAHLRRILGH